MAGNESKHGKSMYFSVVIPTNRSDALLGIAVRSVLRDAARCRVPAEVLVVSDGVDLRGVLDRRVRLVSSRGTGISDALNTGIEAAVGLYVVRMDGDDVWAKGRFADLCRLVETDADILVGSIVKFGAVSPQYESPPPTTCRTLERLLHTGYGFAHPAVAIRRSTVLDSGGYDRTFDGAEDLDLWIRLLSSGCTYKRSLRVHLFYRVRNDQRLPGRAREAAAAGRCLRLRPEAVGNCVKRGCPGRWETWKSLHGGEIANLCSNAHAALGFRDARRSLFRRSALSRTVALRVMACRSVAHMVGALFWSLRSRAAVT